MSWPRPTTASRAQEIQWQTRLPGSQAVLSLLLCPRNGGEGKPGPSMYQKNSGKPDFLRPQKLWSLSGPYGTQEWEESEGDHPNNPTDEKAERVPAGKGAWDSTIQAPALPICVT